MPDDRPKITLANLRTIYASQARNSLSNAKHARLFPRRDDDPDVPAMYLLDAADWRARLTRLVLNPPVCAHSMCETARNHGQWQGRPVVLTAGECARVRR